MKSAKSPASPAPAGIQKVEFVFQQQPVDCFYRGGKLWFIAVQVCGILGLSNTSEALRSLDADEKITLRNPDGNPRKGIPHQIACINESALYSLIFKSRKPRAKAFKRFVTSEVLPALRETGHYEMRPSAADQQAAWLVSQIGRLMPLAKLLELLHPLHDYGSLAGNGLPRKGFRRAAFVAAPNRLEAAHDFHRRAIILEFLLQQLELPLEGRAA